MDTTTKYILKLESGKYWSPAYPDQAIDAMPMDLESAQQMRDQQDLVPQGKFAMEADAGCRDVSPQVDEIIPVEVKEQFIVEIDGEPTASADRFV